MRRERGGWGGGTGHCLPSGTVGSGE
jgi:hypothetical protein